MTASVEIAVDEVSEEDCVGIIAAGRNGATEISPSMRQSTELFRKTLAFYRQRGKPVPPEAENQISLVLENGSRVIALPAGEGTIRGYSVDLLLVDEAARVPDDVFASVLPMTSVTHGKVIALSTPAGKRGWFYEASHATSLRWQHFKLTGPECARLDADELEAERELLGDLGYRQEYLGEFVDAAGAAFDGADVDALFGGGAPARAPSPAADRRAEIAAVRAAMSPAERRAHRQFEQHLGMVERSRGASARMRAQAQGRCEHRWRVFPSGTTKCVYCDVEKP